MEIGARVPTRKGRMRASSLARDCVAVIVLLLITQMYSLASAIAVTVPAYTVSRYMSTVNTTTLYNEGYAQGQAALNRAGSEGDIVFLDFGRPYKFTSGAYGSGIFNNSYVTTTQIAAAVENYAKGWYFGTGSDLNSYLVVAAGTNNYGSGLSAGHGVAWGSMVNSINSWIQNNGYSSQVSAASGSDIELAWSTPASAEAWLGSSGYGSTAKWANYNYGDCQGCPPYSGMPNGWTQYHVWYVSWGLTFAYAVPEIYATNGANANEWQRISLYGYQYHGGQVVFLGSFTQSKACADVGGCTSPCCTNNTPSQGFTQLYNALYNDSRTRQSGLSYSTDITWKN